jgi:hypothetical protein
MARIMNTTFKELNGVSLRNETGATRTLKSYHNKNKSGGNFGFVFRFDNGGLIDCGCGMKCQNEDTFELFGYYMPNNTLYSLNFGHIGRCSSPIPEGYNYSQIIVFMNQYIRQYQEAKKVK